MVIPEGLRARKKARTREAIVDNALRLFEEHGFDHVTIPQIAEAADIAPRTFFGYFRSKEDVVFYDADELVAALQARLETREPGETAIDAMRAWIAAILAGSDFDDPRERCRRRLISEHDGLAGHDRKVLGRFEAVLAEAVTLDLGAPPDSLRARMVAAAAAAALATMGDHYKDEGVVDRSLGDEDPMAPIDEALTFLRGGVAALHAADRAEAAQVPGAG